MPCYGELTFPSGTQEVLGRVAESRSGYGLISATLTSVRLLYWSAALSFWLKRCVYGWFLACGLALLAGCGAAGTSSLPLTGSPSSASPVGVTQGVGVHGRTQSGPQAVTGSRIYILAANTAGYGAPSISLLQAGSPGVATDAIGAYVTTDASGAFAFGGAPRCVSHQLVYILAKGGRTVGSETENPGLALISLLGTCPDAGNFSGLAQFINISEVSTVASVYALSGFMTDGAHLSSAPTEKSFRGMVNAFATASSIFEASTGRALAETPQGSGIVPQAEINTLANMLVPCANSYPACASLFAITKDSGGIPAADTVAALLNIAKNPGANVPALFALANQQAFGPSLAAAPNDWAVAITFFAESMAGAYFPAIDSTGNLWVPGYANNTLTELDPLGNILSGVSGFAGGGLSQPFSVAIDANDNAWVTNYGVGTVGGPSVSEFGASGQAITTNGFSCGAGCAFLAIDTGQNLWVSGSPRVETLRSSGTPVSSFSTNTFASGIAIDSLGHGWVVGQGRNLFRLTLPGKAEQFSQTVTSPSGTEITPVAVDGGDNVWFASSRLNALGKHDPNGLALSPAGGYTGGGLKGPAGMAIDGSNTVWVANRDGNSISAFSNAGAALSPAGGYQAAGISNPRGIAVDASGNVWITNFTGNSVTEFLGVAAPTITPITPSTHGQRP